MPKTSAIGFAIGLAVTTLVACSSSKPASVPTQYITRIQTATVQAPTSTVTVIRTVPPTDGQLAPEACAKLVIGGDGNFGPALCPDGHPNSAVVDFLRDSGYVTIDLDADALASQVLAAMCEDSKTLTDPERSTLYETAAALNGWDFAVPIVNAQGELAQPCPTPGSP